MVRGEYKGFKVSGGYYGNIGSRVGFRMVGREYAGSRFSVVSLECMVVSPNKGTPI